MPSTNTPSLNFNLPVPQSGEYGNDRYSSGSNVAGKQESWGGFQTHYRFPVREGFGQEYSFGYSFPPRLDTLNVFPNVQSSDYPFTTDNSPKTYLNLDTINEKKDSLLVPNDKDKCDGKKTRPKKPIDKTSETYRLKRERNNISVRKSRDKAKQRYKDTEQREDDLISEIEALKKRKQLLQTEYEVLTSILTAHVTALRPNSGANGVN